MEFGIQIIVAVIMSAGTSSGLWAFLQKRMERKGTTTQLVLGLAHDRIVHLGMSYVDRGWVTRDEYDDLIQYLWKPYSKFGGNGLAEKIVADVSNLPIYSRSKAIDAGIKAKKAKESLALDVKEM